MTSVFAEVRSVARAVTLWRNGFHADAQRMCEELVAGREDPGALSMLAEIYENTRRTPESIAILLRLVAVLPKDASTFRRLGNAYQLTGNFTGAEASYGTALALEPRNMRAHNNLGQTFMQLGKLAEARCSFERAIELEPQYAIAHNNLGIALHRQGELEQAVHAYQ